MPFFIYSFITDEGSIVRNSGEYESIEKLYDYVESSGNSIYKVRAIPPYLSSAYKYITVGKAKDKEISEFIRNLSMYLEGGVALQDALSELQNSVNNKALKYSSKTIIGMLNDGHSLSETLTKVGIFPDIVVSMAKIGESSGNLDKTLKDAADYIDRMIEIKSATKRALIYPTFSLFSIIGAFLFWIIYILPQVTELFTSQGIALPLATRMLIAISSFMQNNWIFIVLFIVGFIIITPIALKIEKVKLIFHKALWKSPIMGLIIRSSQMAFYFQYLSLLLLSGVTITESLHTINIVVSNKFFLKSISNVNKDLENGESLSVSFKKSGIFEPIAVRMVQVGEHTGGIDVQMEKLSKIYYTKVQNMVDVISKLIEPIILAFIGIMFVFFVLALISPIYGMLGQMTR